MSGNPLKVRLRPVETLGIGEKWEHTVLGLWVKVTNFFHQHSSVLKYSYALSCEYKGQPNLCLTTVLSMLVNMLQGVPIPGSALLNI